MPLWRSTMEVGFCAFSVQVDGSNRVRDLTRAEADESMKNRGLRTGMTLPGHLRPLSVGQLTISPTAAAVSASFSCISTRAPSTCSTGFTSRCASRSSGSSSRDCGTRSSRRMPRHSPSRAWSTRWSAHSSARSGTSGMADQHTLDWFTDVEMLAAQPVSLSEAA